MTIAGANLGELPTVVLPAGYLGIRPFLLLDHAHTHLLWIGLLRLDASLPCLISADCLKQSAANSLISSTYAINRL